MYPYYMCHYCGKWEDKKTNGVCNGIGYYCIRCIKKPDRNTIWNKIRAKYINIKWGWIVDNFLHKKKPFNYNGFMITKNYYTADDLLLDVANEYDPLAYKKLGPIPLSPYEVNRYNVLKKIIEDLMPPPPVMSIETGKKILDVIARISDALLKKLT